MSFYITENDVVFEMDATVSHSYSLAGSPTTYAVEEGVNSSDHYNKELITLTYSGVVTDVKYATGVSFSQSVSDFEEGIVALRDSGKFFSCSFSDNTKLVNNCLFSNLTVKRSPLHGKFAIEVNFMVQQVRVANVAETTSSPIPFASFVDPAEDKAQGAGSTEQVKKPDLLDWSNERTGFGVDF